MSVGLYDMDMATYTLVPPNLEIMKLSTWYKRKGEVVVLTPTFSPERNSKFIVRKDYDDGNFPKGIMDVEYGGLAFTNNKYVPLPIEIEQCQPDPTIYQRLEGKFMMMPKYRQKVYKDIFNAEHLRLSLDEKTIWPDYRKQFKCLVGARSVIYHDYNLGSVEGAFNEVKRTLEIAKRTTIPVRLGTKFPIQVSSGADLINWASLPTNSVFFGMQFNGMIDNESLMTYAKMDCDRVAYTQMKYNVTRGWSSENEFVMYGLPQILRQVIFSRTYRACFSLMYDDGFFVDKTWEDVIKMIDMYSRSGLDINIDLGNDTVFNFASVVVEKPKLYKTLTVQRMRELFAFVRERQPALFKDFYECSYNSMKGVLT